MSGEIVRGEIIEEIRKWLPVIILLGLGYLAWKYLIKPPPKVVKPDAVVAFGVGQEAPLPLWVPDELHAGKRYLIDFGLKNFTTIDEKPHATSFRFEVEIKVLVPWAPDWVARKVYTTPVLKYEEIWMAASDFTIPETWYLRSLVGRDGTVAVRAFVDEELAGEEIRSFRVASPILLRKCFLVLRLRFKLSLLGVRHRRLKWHRT